MSKDRTADDVAFIKALAELLNEADLAELDVRREYGEDDALKVRLSRYAAAAAPAAPLPPAPAAPAAPAAAPAPEAPAPSEDMGMHPGCVTSPMVGTAYLASEPGAEPFVREGDAVNEGQTLMIVEAMKTMNAIPAPRAGTVKRVLIGDGEPVEYGAPLMIVE